MNTKNKYLYFQKDIKIKEQNLSWKNACLIKKKKNAQISLLKKIKFLKSCKLSKKNQKEKYVK